MTTDTEQAAAVRFPKVCQDCYYRLYHECRIYPQLRFKIEAGKWPRFEDWCPFKPR